MAERFNRENAKKNLAAILDKIYSETDLSLLGEYRKLYKKEISLFRRSWAAAWLFMNYDMSAGGQGGEKPDSFESLSEEESKRLFISIGKNRRLYPRELTALIISKTSAEREDIGSIRILDNYSFIQVRDTKADEIIKALNGHRFRGRTLAVNFAKSKSENTEDK